MLKLTPDIDKDTYGLFGEPGPIIEYRSKWSIQNKWIEEEKLCGDFNILYEIATYIYGEQDTYEKTMNKFQEQLQRIRRRKETENV